MTDPQIYAYYLVVLHAFRYIYFGEFVLKMIALGPCGYFVSGWRQFEFTLLTLTAVEMYEDLYAALRSDCRNLPPAHAYELV